MNADIGFVQFNPALGDPESNLKQFSKLLRNAPRADLFVGPELSLTGYAFKNQKELEEAYEKQEGSGWLSFLKNKSRKMDTALCIGFVEKKKKAFFNSAIFLTPEGKSFVYRKMHLFFQEPRLFQPGDVPPLLVNWRGVRYGIGICLDYLFPEYWRALAERGADVFCLPANLVTDNGQPLMNARSRENRVFSVVCNRWGTERGIAFCGNSQIISPRGEVMAQCSKQDCVKTVKIDVEDARNKFLLQKKGVGYNHVLNSRRPTYYR
jgi:predicted amidohydrolase